jgi:hypothetical protein
MTLSATDRTVREILTTYFFVIPRYQRPYSWEPEQVDDLWQDAVQESEGDYFIGSMVLYSRHGNTVGVIDGQQRLTTLLMLLCSIRNAAAASGNESLANGTHTFIERHDENDERRYVLESETSTPFLHDQILNRAQPELAPERGREEDALRAAFDRLNEKVTALVDSVRLNPSIADDRRAEAIGEELRQVRDKILELRLIFVLLSNQDDATTIFVTLNSRGKDLEPSDLVKAYLLQLLPSRNQTDAPRRRWESIIDAFDATAPRLSMTEFLLAFWRSRYGTTSAKKLHKDVKDRIRTAQAPHFLDELVEDSHRFVTASDPDTRTWPREAFAAVESLRFLRDFGIRQPMPLVLGLVRALDQGLISVRGLARALRAIEDYVFTWTVLAGRSSSGGLSAMYARIARDLLAATDGNQRGRVLTGLAQELRGRRPMDAEIESAFCNLWFTEDRSGDKKVVQYALRRIYRDLSTTGAAAIDFTHMTIEHVAPQSANLANSGRIGNLLYVTDDLNRHLGERAWSEKRRLLQEAQEWVPEEVLQAPTWDEPMIEARTRQLAQLARTRVWRG